MPHPSSPPLLRAENISVHIGPATLLDQVCFALNPGDFLAVIGPNGAGKTTLIRTLLGLTPANHGQFFLNDAPLSQLSPKAKARHLAYVPQSATVSEFHRVWDFVMMGRYPYLSPLSAPTEEDRAVVTAALQQTQMWHLAERNLSNLSGGERQKIMISAALAQQPDILILDEPDTFLDPKNQQEILALLGQLNREQGLTILCITHDLNSALEYANRVLGLKNGQVFLDGPTKEALTPDSLQRLFKIPFLSVSAPDAPRQWLVPDGSHHGPNHAQQQEPPPHA